MFWGCIHLLNYYCDFKDLLCFAVLFYVNLHTCTHTHMLTIQQIVLRATIL